MFNAANAVATEKRVFASEAEAKAAQPTFPPKSNELGAVYADPKRLRELADVAEKNGGVIGWSIDDSGRMRVRNVAVITLGLTSPAPGKAKSVVIVEKVVAPKDMTLEQLKAALAAAEAVAANGQPAPKTLEEVKADLAKAADGKKGQKPAVARG